MKHTTYIRSIAFLAALLLLLTVSSCTKVDSNPDSSAHTPPAQETPTVLDYETGRFLIAQRKAISWNDILVYSDAYGMDIPTGTLHNLCGDPLCKQHNVSSCQMFSMYAKKFFVISPKESANGNLVIYFDSFTSRLPEDLDDPYDASLFFRYDYQSQTLTTYDFYFDPVGNGWTFDAENCIIYYTAYQTTEAGNTVISLFALDTQTGNNRFLTHTTGQTTVAGMYNGQLLIEVYGDGYYTLDPSADAPSLTPYEGITGTYYDGYFYYFRNTDSITASRPENIADYTWDNNSRKEFTVTYGDLYRTSLKDGGTELVCEDISMILGLRFDRGYLLYEKACPEYLYSLLYDAYQGKYYEINDPNAPDSCVLQARFASNNGKYYLLHLESMEEKTIDISGYGIATPILFAPQSKYLLAMMENLTLEGTLDRYNNYPFGSAVPDCYYYLPYADDFSQGAQDVVLLSMPR